MKCLQDYGFSEDELIDAIESDIRFRQVLIGKSAELRLKKLLQTKSLNFQHIQKDGEPDFIIILNNKIFSIEVKNVLKSYKYSCGSCKVDLQRTRISKQDPSSRYYSENDFNILAACLYNKTGNFDYKFILSSKIPKHKKYSNKISNNLKLSNDLPWYDSIEDLLKEIS